VCWRGLLLLLFSCALRWLRLPSTTRARPLPPPPPPSPLVSHHTPQITIYFTRATNRVDVSSSEGVAALLSISPSPASLLRASWRTGGDAAVPGAQERLVVSLGGTVNTDVVRTLVPLMRVGLNGTAGLTDAAGRSAAVDVAGLRMNVRAGWRRVCCAGREGRSA
jgi:hypothetical protein